MCGEGNRDELKKFGQLNGIKWKDSQTVRFKQKKDVKLFGFLNQS